MVRPARERLSGTVEVDETYVGSIAENTRGRGAEWKFIVVIAIELPDLIGFGRVRLRRIADVSSDSLTSFVKYAAEPGNAVRTDAWNGYNELPKCNYRHLAINLSATGDPAHVVMPGVHKVATLLKRWLLGTHQDSVTATHLDAYLDKFAFHFNCRKSRRRRMLFYRCWKIPWSQNRRASGHRGQVCQPENTTASGYCTQGATPLMRIFISIFYVEYFICFCGESSVEDIDWTCRDELVARQFLLLVRKCKFASRLIF
jgi:hypothetical protein